MSNINDVTARSQWDDVVPNYGGLCLCRSRGRFVYSTQWTSKRVGRLTTLVPHNTNTHICKANTAL